MVVFGTRPEAIKMCPLVKELKKETAIQTCVCVTGQHREILQQVLEVFKVEPDINLDLMKDKQSLYDITVDILSRMDKVLESEQPDLVLVHGDTTTTFVTSLAAFYKKIPIGHVEAGLRTYNISDPFPEEFNRESVGLLANYHFAPTEVAARNLLIEGKPRSAIVVTGNTAIDALKTTVKKAFTNEILEWAKGSRLILLTAHRRENIGKPLHDIFCGIKRIVQEFDDIKVVYPVHPNPLVREIANEVFAGEERIRLTEPYNVLEFHNMMSQSYLIMTDSGGIQEEAPSLGKPVLVLRNVTERMEGVHAGTLQLIGTEEEGVYQGLKTLLKDNRTYQAMSEAKNPFGDGMASRRIIDFIKEKLN